MMTESLFTKLRDLLLNEFTEAEVVQLCQELGLNYETLPGTGYFGKTRGLLEVADRQDKLQALKSRMRALRPDAYSALEGPAMAGVASDSATAPSDGAVSDTVVPSMGESTDVARETRGLASRMPIPLLPLALIGLILTLLLFGFLLPRVLGGSTSAGATATAVAALPPPATVTTIPVIQDVAPADVPVPTDTPASAAGVVVVATSNEPVALVTALPTIAVIAGQATAAPQAIGGSGEAHPAALAFKDINARLPAFYRGEIGKDVLQDDWRDQAYSGLVAFSASQMPRALRLGTTSRSELDITYEYVKAPVVTAENGNRYTVQSREYWHYGNKANGVTRCDTRDYTYAVLNDNGKFVVTGFSSKVVESGCR